MRIPPIGKFIDQPLLVNKLHKYMPALLVGAAAAFGVHDTLKQPPEERKTRGVKNAIVLSTIVGASLGGVKLVNKLFPDSAPKSLSQILKTSGNAVETFMKDNPSKDWKLVELLNKSRAKILSLKATDYVLKNIQNSKGSQGLSDALFGKVENLDSKGIFKEIGKLSIMGFVPVAAGIGGGIAADKATKTGNNTSTANKVKEGVYQFLANIFMCNVGAAGALFAAEALQKNGIIKKLTPLKKTGIIMAGITVTGIIGGSHIANFISSKFLDPVFDRKIQNDERNARRSCEATQSQKPHHGKHCRERTPEPLDIMLHTDDIATAGVLSGFKWIEPVLPLMYMISGYRAGFGYRNNLEKEHKHPHMHTEPDLIVHSHRHPQYCPVLEEKLHRAALEYKQMTPFK